MDGLVEQDRVRKDPNIGHRHCCKKFSFSIWYKNVIKYRMWLRVAAQREARKISALPCKNIEKSIFLWIVDQM